MSENSIRILIAVITATITAGIPLIFHVLQPPKPLHVVLQDLRLQEPDEFNQYIETELQNQSQAIMDHSNTGVLLNGIELDCYSVDKTTYISLSDLLRASNGMLKMDADNSLMFFDPPESIAESIPLGQNWLETCPPYELGKFSLVQEADGHSMQISGCLYTDGLHSDAAWNSQVLFNLQGKYRTLTVLVGHVDGSAMVDCTYNFYVDGLRVKSVTVKADALPVSLEIPLNYGQQLKIENLDTIAYTEFGFFNGQFSG